MIRNAPLRVLIVTAMYPTQAAPTRGIFVLEQVEALRQELTYFVECINNGRDPHNDGHAGLRVVRMLEAATASLNEKGALVSL